MHAFVGKAARVPARCLLYHAGFYALGGACGFGTEDAVVRVEADPAARRRSR